MNVRRAPLVIGLATLAALAAPPALADDAPPRSAKHEPATIAVVSEPGDTFGLRLVAEIEALGLHAVIVSPAESASRASLEAAAREANALAAIRSVASDHGVEIWIADRVTNKTVLREVVRADGGREPDDALALRAVELLRASLLEVSLPMPPRGEIPATPEIRARLVEPKVAPPEAPAPRLRLAIAPALLVSPGGFGPTTSLALGLAWMPAEHVGVSAFAAVPIARPTVTGDAGRVELSALVGGAAVRFGANDRAARWTPTADLGLAMIALEASGTPNAGFVARSASGVNAAPFLSLGMGFAASKNVRLRADVLVAVLAIAAKIEDDRQQAATWGAPLVMPSLGADVGWF